VKNKIYIHILFGIPFLLSSCITFEKVYLQDAEVTGPINQSPIHITDSTETPSVSLSMRFSYNPEKEIKATTEGTPPVNSQGFYQVDTFYNNGSIIYRRTPGVNTFQFQGQNLTWNFAAITTGLDFDLKLSRNFALFAGVLYSGGNNKSLWGGNAGIGVFGVSKGIAFRLDAGIQIQNIAYDAYTIAEVQSIGLFSTTDDERVFFSHDIDNATYFDPFVNFTFNTSKVDWVFNIFFNAGYSIQTLLDFEPKTYDYLWYPFPPFLYEETITSDFRGETTAGFIHFTPGIYFNLSEQSRIDIGVRFFYETQLEDASQNLFILPMLQIDFTL
jgi:hypothetical protein